MKHFTITNYTVSGGIIAILIIYPAIHWAFFEMTEFIKLWGIASLFVVGVALMLISLLFFVGMLDGSIEFKIKIPNPFYKEKHQVSDSLLSELGKAIERDDEAEIISLSKQITKK